MKRIAVFVFLLLAISITFTHTAVAQPIFPVSCFVTSLGELNTGSAQRSALPELDSFTHYPENTSLLASEMLAYADQQLTPLHDPDTGLLLNENSAADLRNSAVVLLLWAELGETDLLNRAVESLLAEQFLDPLGADYGLFPGAAGGTSGRADSAMFVGTSLMLVHDRYGHLLDDALLQQLRTAIYAAAVHTSCQNFFFRHTNYLLLRTYQLLRAGEILDDPQLTASGTALWNYALDFTLSNGISEFNSTNYMRWNIYALSFIVDYVEDAVIVDQAQRLRLLFWWSVVNHYFPAAQQISGPFSRTFTDRMLYEATHFQSLLHIQSGGAIPHSLQEPEDANPYDSIYAALLEPSLPSDWLEMVLTPANPARTYQERVAIWRRGFQQSTTYLDEFFTLGSLNNADLRLNTNAEARLLTAYQVTPESGDVGVFTLRTETPVSAGMNVVQQGRSLLGAIWLGRLERQVEDAQILLHFTWSGTEAYPPSISLGNSISVVDWMDTQVLLYTSHASHFPTFSIEPLSTTEATSVGLSLRFPLPPQLYRPAEGENATLPILFALHFSQTGIEPQLMPIHVFQDAESQLYRISWLSPDGDQLDLALPTAPLPTSTFWEVGQAYINGQLVEQVPLGAEMSLREDSSP